MKKILSTFLVCCTAFAFANDEPVFEETDEYAKMGTYKAFAIEDPIFEDDDEKEYGKECEEYDEKEPSRGKKGRLPLGAMCGKPLFEGNEEDHDRFNASYSYWPRFKASFGIEKIFVRFPQKPSISRNSTLLTAYAYDYTVLYSVTGYFPPVGSICPAIWFDEVLYAVDHYPYSLISHATFQVSNGDWVMDYVTHDYVQDLIVKARAIITPFNAYTLQYVKPNGTRDYFDYFLDNFWLRCDCN